MRDTTRRQDSHERSVRIKLRLLRDVRRGAELGRASVPQAPHTLGRGQSRASIGGVPSAPHPSWMASPWKHSRMLRFHLQASVAPDELPPPLHRRRHTRHYCRLYSKAKRRD
eukprot:scaffold130549_cov31-Tisochrysis_lutea.AAC.7